jgi:alpha-L-fucosidase
MINAQHTHFQSATYQYPADPEVRAKLDQWQDRKFGMIIHWGIYAVPGVIESWGICSEDWIYRDSTTTYEKHKREYWDLAKDFNPVQFNPDQWAEAAKDAGMNYVVFTTKHHDGFCMFDSRETDYSIAKGPFKDNPKADVAKYVFEAFRNQGFMIGAYFSKPDWHSQYYWWDKYATPDRNNNYDIRKNPWRWDKFKEYTYNQIGELMQRYGRIDILWLDGGWVRPLETVTEEVLSWGARIPEWNQDIDMPRIVEMARKHQPGLLVVDRTVHGPYENYQTPEQRIPEQQLEYPWEACMTLANNWGYVKRDRCKPSAKVIHSLIEIVAKGGSLLLGVGPTPEGILTPEAVQRLQEIGRWTSKNGKAIYGARITTHYHEGDLWFTQSKDGKKLYALYCIGQTPAGEVEWTGNEPAKNSKIILLQTGKPVKWKKAGNKTIVKIPGGLPADLPALAFEIQK